MWVATSIEFKNQTQKTKWHCHGKGITPLLAIENMVEQIQKFKSQKHKDFKTKKIEKTNCDMCGKPIKGKKFQIVDENFNIQKGLIQCEKCYKNGVLN